MYTYTMYVCRVNDILHMHTQMHIQPKPTEIWNGKFALSTESAGIWAQENFKFYWFTIRVILCIHIHIHVHAHKCKYMMYN